MKEFSDMYHHMIRFVQCRERLMFVSRMDMIEVHLMDTDHTHHYDILSHTREDYTNTFDHRFSCSAMLFASNFVLQFYCHINTFDDYASYMVDTRF